MRIDGKFHLSDGLQVRKLIKNAPYKVKSIFDVTSNIYCPGIFQRHYTSSGTPFLGGADIQKQSYDSGKYLKESTTPNHEILAIKKGWTLVTCGGTVGETAFANRELAKCWVSQHVMRLIPDGIKPGMLYSRSLKTIFQHKACTVKLYADSFYKVQKNSHSSFEVICCCS